MNKTETRTPVKRFLNKRRPRHGGALEIQVKGRRLKPGQPTAGFQNVVPGP